MREDRIRWEGRYASGARTDAASEFLVTHAERIQGRVLDLAAGAGRNALFLARRGHTVDAIDISLTALRRVRTVAEAEQLRVFTVQADLESFPLPRAHYDAVLNFRYLQRTLFGAMQQALKPGGLIVFETFLADQRFVGHPTNPNHLLQRGELWAAFSGCEALVYEEGRFGDAQPAYLARMLARR